jgi:hypothetical protein
MKQIRASASPVFGSAPFDTSTTNDYMPRAGRAELWDLAATSHQAPSAVSRPESAICGLLRGKATYR